MNHPSRGFSTLEIVIAMAIMVTVLSSAILTSFGNQSMLADAQVNSEMLSVASTLMEHEQGLARKDFALANSTATTTDGMYEESISVIPWNNDPYTTKHVSISVSSSSTRQFVTLTTLISNFMSPVGADTCDSSLSGDWTAPRVSTYTFATGDLLPWITPLGHTYGSASPIAALDAYQGRLYMILATTSVKTNDSFFIFNTSALGTASAYLGSIDTNAASIDGGNALRVAGNYAYLANAHGGNFKTCKPGASCSQLQIITITNPSSIPAPINYLLPTSSPPYVLGNMTSSGQAVGKSILYKDGYVYLGLSKTASGPEFNIIDVHDPTHPTWVGGYAVGAGVSAITVVDHYAYLATDDSTRDLTVLNISNPSRPVLAGVYNAPDPSGWSNGRSLYSVGDEIFLGTTYATSAPELYMLDTSNETTPQFRASSPVGGSVIGIVVRDYLSFVLTSTLKQLQILKLTDSNISSYGTPISIPGVGTALDCEGNTLFAASNSGTLSTITAL